MKMDIYHCLIRTRFSYIILYVYNYSYMVTSPICILSNSSITIYKLMNYHDQFLNFSSSHLLYLGRELYKAELSLKLGQQYIQD